MKTKRLLIAFVLIILAGILIAPGFSPKLAVRRHLFLVNPMLSMTCSINESGYIDKDYGRQFSIAGFVEKDRDGIYFAYAKKSSLGLYYWSGGGSGP